MVKLVSIQKPDHPLLGLHRVNDICEVRKGLQDHGLIIPSSLMQERL